jgi:hypothetical protein
VNLGGAVGGRVVSLTKIVKIIESNGPVLLRDHVNQNMLAIKRGVMGQNLSEPGLGTGGCG